MIHSSTVLPDLSPRASQGFDIPHLDHGGHKVRLKGPGIPAVSSDQRIGESAIEEDLIGVKQPPLVEEVLEVLVVEVIGSDEVEVCADVVP